MKYLMLLISCLFIFGCGVKKELAVSETKNDKLELQISELQRKNEKLLEENEKLFQEVLQTRMDQAWFETKVYDLRKKKDYLKNIIREIEKNSDLPNKFIPREDEFFIEIFQEPLAPKSREVFKLVEKMPEFPGG